MKSQNKKRLRWSGLSRLSLNGGGARDKYQVQEVYEKIFCSDDIADGLGVRRSTIDSGSEDDSG